MAGAAPTPVANTKHNLSTSGPGTIKSTGAGTSEICVFCHTPHSATTDAPLWNKSISNASYTVYTSDVLSQLGGGAYPGAVSPATGAPHVKTRICLACHDGTIALGSLVNMPSGVSSIPMQGTGADYKMPQTAAGYMGIDLRDDHPVAILHDSTKDGELSGTITGNVWLYTSTAAKTQVGTGTGYVECTSCHEPHNNQFGNFLVASNTGSTICTTCHTKTGFALSIHDTATLGYAPTDGTPTGNLGTTVGLVKCMDCHFPHKSGVTSAAPTTPNPSYGKYVLSFQEEASCYNNPNDRWNSAGASGACHGSGAAGLNAARRNIQSLVNETTGKTSKHRIENSLTAGLHKATEGMGITGYGWSNVATNWHAECADCHNPHTAGSATRTVGSNTISSTSPLNGVAGVNVAWPAGGWTNPLGAIAYTYVTGRGVTDVTSAGVDMEYKICLKCHSDFAWGGAVSPAPNLTNQAQEFNPNNNAGYHPVVQNNVNTYSSAALNAPWNSLTSTMYCSDCHGNNDPLQAQGPHGSMNTPLLKKVYGSAVVLSTDATFLCFDCHNGNTYGRNGTGAANTTGFSDGTQNLHTLHATTYDQPCKGCHVAIPHGYQSPTGRIVANRGLLLTEGTGDPAPYRGAVITNGGGLGTANNMWLYIKTLKTSGSWAPGDCTWNVSTNPH